MVAVFDLEKHQPIVFLPVAKGPDLVKFDSGLKRIPVACYSGAIFPGERFRPLPEAGRFLGTEEGSQLCGGLQRASGLRARTGSGSSSRCTHDCI